jgi:hypothetical protein
MKNSKDTIENQSRDLPVCSAVPRPLHHRVPRFICNIYICVWVVCVLCCVCVCVCFLLCVCVCCVCVLCVCVYFVCVTPLDADKILDISATSASYPIMFFFSRVFCYIQYCQPTWHCDSRQTHSMKSQAFEPSKRAIVIHFQISKRLWNVTSTPCVLLHRVVFRCRYRGNLPLFI